MLHYDSGISSTDSIFICTVRQCTGIRPLRS